MQAAGEQHAKAGQNDIEAVGNNFADLVECTAAARTNPKTITFLEIAGLLNPLEIGGQRSAVRIAQEFAKSLV